MNAWKLTIRSDYKQSIKSYYFNELILPTVLVRTNNGWLVGSGKETKCHEFVVKNKTKLKTTK
jgi:hypothetical protein